MLEKSVKDMNIYEKTERICELLSDEESVSGELARAENLRRKLCEKDMTVAVIGQFKRGKSALSNSILGDEIMPVGIVPVTSAVTKVVAGEKRAEVCFENGKVEEVDFRDLHMYISEQENKNNELGIKEVVLHAPSEFLKRGLTFVDTPGVGSFHKNNTEVAYDHMKESDAVIFLLSVDSPINQIEIDFLKNAREFAARFYFAVNKIDTVSYDELNTYLEYCKMVLAKLMGEENIRMFPVSAKTMEGTEKLKDAIIQDLRVSPEKIMEESTSKKLYDLINDGISQLNFYWKAMNMEYKELDDRFNQIELTLADIRRRAESCPGAYNLFINEFKRELSGKVHKLFGMEYHYDIDLLKIGLTELSKEEFLKKTEELCSDLSDTLNRILLYREENAYTVCRRINKINRLTRELRRIRDSLKAEA
ncbi:MAG: dynamin family protein [Hornefia sp.]|nr:dynamin family protein [Hornefia sp.]